MEMITRNQLGTFRQMSDIFYMMKMNIEELHTERIDDGTTRINLVLKTEDEDYYIYDRLVDRLKISVPEFISARLVELR